MESYKGKRVDKTVAVSDWYFVDKGTRKEKVIDVDCDCGRPTRTVNFSRFKTGKIKSCGCNKTGSIPARFVDHTGEVYNRLEVVANFTDEKVKEFSVLVKCSCGSEPFVTRYSSIKSGYIKSCGCLKEEMIGKTNLKHGLSGSKIFDVWYAMKDRCLNPNNKNFPLYGGRGVKVCDSWLDSSVFFADMLPTYEEGLYLDRIDPDGDYEPHNCRWVSPNVSNHNKRKRTGCSSSFIGVSYYPSRDNWLTEITVEGESVFIGYFSQEEQAACAYDNASEVYYGDRPNKTLKE